VPTELYREVTMLYEKKGRYIVEFPDIPTKRQHHIEIEVDERRMNNKEVELGFDEERALKEAKRCLSCRRCLGCALCWAECKPEAIMFDMQDEILDLEADSVIVSPGVERAIDRIDRKFGLGKELNVITDLQLERMLSDSGPSAGLIIRPLDGDIPSRIAFIQGYASSAPQMHKTAVIFGVNEAILVKRKLPNAQVTFFAEGLDAVLKEAGATPLSLNGTKPVEAPVKGVEATADGSLQVTFGPNDEKASFDLVVLLTQPQVSKELKDLGKNLGLTLSYASFLAGDGTGIISTEKETVGLAGQA
jgi:heterodisulfide reductase subunit A-like polyferredoxin